MGKATLDESWCSFPKHSSTELNYKCMFITLISVTSTKKLVTTGNLQCRQTPSFITLFKHQEPRTPLLCPYSSYSDPCYMGDALYEFRFCRKGSCIKQALLCIKFPFSVGVILEDIDQENMMLKWQNGLISNYDYLSYLNR